MPVRRGGKTPVGPTSPVPPVLRGYGGAVLNGTAGPRGSPVPPVLRGKGGVVLSAAIGPVTSGTAGTGGAVLRGTIGTVLSGIVGAVFSGTGAVLSGTDGFGLARPVSTPVLSAGLPGTLALNVAGTLPVAAGLGVLGAGATAVVDTLLNGATVACRRTNGCSAFSCTGCATTRASGRRASVRSARPAMIERGASEWCDGVDTTSEQADAWETERARGQQRVRNPHDRINI